MGSSWDTDESEPRAARSRHAYKEHIQALKARRQRLFERDAFGRTLLFYAAEEGLEEQVREMIFSLRGTGLFPPRLALIAKKDQFGLTAADVAEAQGHKEVAHLLRAEQVRMEYFE